MILIIYEQEYKYIVLITDLISEIIRWSFLFNSKHAVTVIFNGRWQKTKTTKIRHKSPKLWQSKGMRDEELLLCPVTLDH